LKKFFLKKFKGVLYPDEQTILLDFYNSLQSKPKQNGFYKKSIEAID